jgi:hypothetical protein
MILGCTLQKQWYKLEKSGINWKKVASTGQNWFTLALNWKKVVYTRIDVRVNWKKVV